MYVILEDALNTLQQVPGFVSFTQPLTVPQVLAVTISGIGTVYSSSATTGTPGNITCASYPEGSTVTLTASPSWYSSTSWGGTDSRSGTTASVVMNSPSGFTTIQGPFIITGGRLNIKGGVKIHNVE